ncbi:hypothetical protein BX616_008583 [Lobosporangium transversale]|uniref:FYVE-type domain-containing protein n=1 Tax=Lobosporangium transversale TaxID=64571 RepID=A0A1Y2GRG0_9FUNG|nr:hypothetical protein BCR41DRAFT_370276 [Lobosporangium transversale]KAF9914299.1 hypothetical protein BX616_008583 [Lobosporangium transversale]ORZ17464.1 hypothetical protein BCR41DRAFT_370276 [Lobosporangium transversale]|eukprot:XP_021881851.1 hypothetical protein BCR41DRAFT_370276 [Lobosporangium transversale]
MTYLQQQQQQPPPLPPFALPSQQFSQHQLHQQRMYQHKQQLHHQSQHQNRFQQLQQNQQQRVKRMDAVYPHVRQESAAKVAEYSLVHHLNYPAAMKATVSSLQSSKDQTREELTTAMQSHMENQPKLSQNLPPESIQPSIQSNTHHAASGKDVEESDNEDYYYDDGEDDGEDDSEFSDDEDVDEDEYGDHDNVAHHNNNSNHKKPEHPIRQMNPDTITTDRNISNGSAQMVQQELTRQMTMAAGAWKKNGIDEAKHSLPSKSSKGINHLNRSPPSTRNNEASIKGASIGTSAATPGLGTERNNESRLPHLSKAQMMPYVGNEDEDEDEDEDQDEDEDDDGYDDEDSEDYDPEEDEDYSYSEDEGDEEDEEDEDGPPTAYQYSTRDGPRATTGIKSRTAQTGHYSRAPYNHYRPPRLDENYLKKRAITKHVVRRSSLTALLGEATQSESDLGDRTIHPSMSLLGQHHRQSGHNNRRPALSDVWIQHDHDQMIMPSSGAANMGSTVTADNRRDRQIQLVTSPLVNEHRRSMMDRATTITSGALSSNTTLQDPHRPRRTDSGVEVKLSPQEHRGSGGIDSGSDDRQSRQLQDKAMTDPSSLSSTGHSSVIVSSSTSSFVDASACQSRIKLEDNSLGRESPSPGSSTGTHVNPTGSSSSASGSNALQCTKPLKSSISCHTFPRAVGKKHVSWHHSLFPTEHVLRVKPSLPSLSSVAVESANAILSQLPSIPVMTRDRVEGFHQSIRSLRTLSRIEITKMSYKQQGRQELTSSVPISKSAYDSLPWWNLSRWFRGSVTIDKRHWKPDSSRESCAYCFAPFHRLTNPRHHCRKCGDLFCGKCASAEILMDAKNCVYVQQSQLARWSRRVDLQRHSLWIDTLPQLHPVRTAAESALIAGSDGHGSIGHANGLSGGAGTLGSINMGHRINGSGSGNGHRSPWQLAPGSTKKSRLSIFGLFGNGVHGSAAGNTASDSRRGSMDIPNTEGHYANPMTVTFATGRRSSSSSILRSATGTSSHLLMTGAALGSNEGALPTIAMSRRMSSGGVGEVCLARICVGCERELLKPVPRCNSIAKYYGSVKPRGGYQPPIHGYSSLGPHAGRQHVGPQLKAPYLVEDDIDPTVTGRHEYLAHGVRRHSPLRKSSHMADITAHCDNDSRMTPHDRPSGNPAYFNQGGRAHQSQVHGQGCGYGPCANGGWVSQGNEIGPHGETRYHQNILTFQEQQLHYTQQAVGPFCREMC